MYLSIYVSIYLSIFPDLCDPRAVRRAARSRKQAEAGCNTTATRFEKKEDFEVVSVPVVDVAPHHKTLPSTQPVQHHRAGSNPPPTHSSAGLHDEPLRHPKRDSNASNLDRTKETKIQFPPPSDSIWKSINDELEIALPTVFNRRKFKNSSTSELSKSLDKWLYVFFCEKFGVKEPVLCLPRKRPPCS